ncbi:hypothetical protein [Saccharococcus caldoxylosilyticus]|uniref:hypothetical protein n=1 Tax=Saccharococcus caldoxylosilyticus TaxID=81408 RepID=UPI00077979EE|nr:hypothetical protein [Parageobacillus caldoxylosilyticus]MBB3852926.1 hypothetical protein [Parageobacillus caldoxylosilyticus]
MKTVRVMKIVSDDETQLRSYKNESETPLGCRVRIDGRILQAIEKRQETTTISRHDVTQNREFQTRA